MKYKKTLIDALQHTLLFNMSSMFLPQSQNFNTFLNEPIDHGELIQNEYINDIKPKNIISFIKHESPLLSDIAPNDPLVAPSTFRVVFNKQTALKNSKTPLNIFPVNIEKYSTNESIQEVPALHTDIIKEYSTIKYPNEYSQEVPFVEMTPDNQPRSIENRPMILSSDPTVSVVPPVEYSSDPTVSVVPPVEYSSDYEILTSENKLFPEHITTNNLSDTNYVNTNSSNDSTKYVSFSRKFKNGFFNPNIIDKSRIKRFLFREYSGDSKTQNIINEKLENIPAFAKGGSISADSIDYSAIATNEPGSSKNERISISADTNTPTSISRINDNADKSGSDDENTVTEDLNNLVNCVVIINNKIKALKNEVKTKEDIITPTTYDSNIVRSAYNSVNIYRR